MLEAAGDKVVLVGHSYAGTIISRAVESNSTKIETLVFLDAFIPEDGQCVLDLLPPQICSLFRNVARERGDGWLLPSGESQLDLWGLKPREARDVVRERLCDLVCGALRNRFLFARTIRPVFRRPLSAVLRNNTPIALFSNRLRKRRALTRGKSRR